MQHKLTDFLDTAALREIQERFSALGRVCVAFENADGSVITRSAPACVATAESSSPAAEHPRSNHTHVVPIVVDQRPIARLVIRAQDRVSAEVSEFAEALSRTLGRLGSEEKRLRRRVRELSAVYEMATLLAGTYDVQTVLDKTAAQVCAVMRVAACSVRLLADDRNDLQIRAVHNLSDAYVNKGPVTVASNAVDAEALRGRCVYIANLPEDPRTQYPDQAREEGIVSALAAGILHRGRPLGVIRAYTRRRRRFSPFQASLLQALASQAASAIANVRGYEEVREIDQWQRQIRYAGEIQRRMIPEHAPRHATVEFGTAYDPTFDVGGDFYDFVPLPGGHLGIAIADVVGKGVPAALMMASLRSALRVYAHTVYNLNEIIGHVNRHFHRDTLASEFATAFYGVLAPDGRRLTYCNAGHPPPLLVRDGVVRLLETGGMVLGVQRDLAFAKEVVDLCSGDVLLLYTDGVVEATDFAGQAYGMERLDRSLQAKVSLKAELIAHDLLWDVRRFVGLAPQTDDLTLVVVRVL